MWSIIAAIFSAIWGVITGKSRSTDERLGNTEAANVELKAGLEAVKKADDAAKKVEEEARNEPYDPNDRADPRNAGKQWL